MTRGNMAANTEQQARGGGAAAPQAHVPRGASKGWAGGGLGGVRTFREEGGEEARGDSEERRGDEHSDEMPVVERECAGCDGVHVLHRHQHHDCRDVVHDALAEEQRVQHGLRVGAEVVQDGEIVRRGEHCAEAECAGQQRRWLVQGSVP